MALRSFNPQLLLWAVSLPLFLFAVLWAGSARSQETRPNIIVIMVDDADAKSIDRLLREGEMPQLQSRLIDHGFRFNNAFVTNSLCCPSRATFLTGQYSHNHSVLHNAAPEGSITAFDDSSTLATWLQAAGYRTSHVGKYLNGYGYSDLNGDGRLDGEDWRYVPPGWTDWQTLIDFSTYRVYDYWINDNGRIAYHGNQPEDYQTDVLAERARRFIAESEAADSQPFFMAVLPLAPHVEIIGGVTSFEKLTDIWRWTIRPAPRHQDSLPSLGLPLPPSYNERDVSDKPAWLQARPSMTLADTFFLSRQYRQRLQSMLSVDDLVGSLFDALESHGEIDNTIVLFTSDNGFLHGEHRLAEKLFAYEEAIRVPLFLRHPDMAGPRNIEQYVINNDLAATIADFAAATATHELDGTSFRPLLNSPGPTAWRKSFLIEHWFYDSIFDLPDYAALRTAPELTGLPNLLYLEYTSEQQTPEFYDLQRDPFQLNSLHQSGHPSRIWQRQRLSKALDQYRDCAGQGCRDLEFGRLSTEME